MLHVSPSLILPAVPMFSLRGRSNAPQPRDQPWSKEVRISAKTVLQTCENYPAELFDLAGLVGWLKVKFPTSTGYHVEAVTGITAASVENWLQHRSRPSVEHFSIMFCVFGPALIKAAVKRPADWIDRACEAERLVEIEQEISRLSTERAALTGG